MSTSLLAAIVATLAAAAIGLATPAGAHGGLQESTPAADARVKRVPGRVSMTFDEVPSKDSVMKVVDGCRRNVVRSTSVEGNALVGALAAGQPGKWKASYRVISAEDGHLTKGKYSFTVGGERDCTPEDGGGEGNGNGSDDPGAASPGDPGGAAGDESEFPVVPVALGAAGLLVVGLVVRRVSGA